MSRIESSIPRTRSSSFAAVIDDVDVGENVGRQGLSLHDVGLLRIGWQVVRHDLLRCDRKAREADVRAVKCRHILGQDLED
jgi:hypothetical protein